MQGKQFAPQNFIPPFTHLRIQDEWALGNQVLSVINDRQRDLHYLVIEDAAAVSLCATEDIISFGRLPVPQPLLLMILSLNCFP